MADWNKLTNDCLAHFNCTEDHIERAGQTSDPGEGAKSIAVVVSRRTDVRRAIEAVKQAYERNPGASPDKVRREAYRSLAGSILLIIFMQFILPIIVKAAVEWLIDRLYSEGR